MGWVRGNGELELRRKNLQESLTVTILHENALPP